MIFMKIKRKAQGSGGTLGMIGTIVLVLIVVFFVGKWFTGTTSDAAASTGSINLRNKYELCKIAGEKFKERGQGIPESIEGKITFKGRSKPGDGFPDSCDICLGGDDNKMSNSYWIPDACFWNPDKEFNGETIKNYKQMCKIVYKGKYCSKSDRCCLDFNLPEGVSCPSQCI